MNAAIATIIIQLLNFAFELWRTHAGKPAGWKPTQADIDALMAEVDAATPAAEKEAARKRLGIQDGSSGASPHQGDGSSGVSPHQGDGSPGVLPHLEMMR